MIERLLPTYHKGNPEGENEKRSLYQRLRSSRTPYLMHPIKGKLTTSHEDLKKEKVKSKSSSSTLLLSLYQKILLQQLVRQGHCIVAGDAQLRL